MHLVFVVKNHSIGCVFVIPASILDLLLFFLKINSHGLSLQIILHSTLTVIPDIPVFQWNRGADMKKCVTKQLLF